MPDLRFSSKYKPLFNVPRGVRYVVMTGGRGSGKSFALASGMVSKADAKDGYKILYTRYTMQTADDSIIAEFEEKLELLAVKDRFERTGKDFKNTATNSEFLFRGIKTNSGNQTAKLKSLQGINVWILDEAEELDSEEDFDKIDLSVRDSRRNNLIVLVLNPTHVKHWIHRRFYEDAGVPDGFNGVKDDVLYIHTDYRDNAALRRINPQYYAIAERTRKKNQVKWNHIWLGGWLQELEGALWTWNMIQDYRVDASDVPELERIIVGVDPAVTSTKTSDETGIVTAARGVNGHYYVIEDASIKASPLLWARAASGQYHKHSADRVVGEVNNGGDLVEITLRQVDREIPYKAVHASRGKTVRAEPIAALYEQGLVHHVGTFSDLETEMMTYTGAANDSSPDHLDAMVWALHELSGGKDRAFIACDDEAEEVQETTEIDLIDNEDAWT